jgi:hypothetical protein
MQNCIFGWLVDGVRLKVKFWVTILAKLAIFMSHSAVIYLCRRSIGAVHLMATTEKPSFALGLGTYVCEGLLAFVSSFEVQMIKQPPNLKMIMKPLNLSFSTISCRF